MVQTDSPQVTEAVSLPEQIDEALRAYTDFTSDCPAELASAIRYGLLSPGKRLRSRLVVLAAQTCGGSPDSALPAACAVEMVHAYSLIHDDLPAMDDDDLRRGRPTCHKRFGEATAILAGDALLTLAFDVLARDVQPPHVAARCCQILARAAGATGLVGGQADDLAAARSRESEVRGSDDARSVHDGSDCNSPARDDRAGDCSCDERLELLASIHRRKTAALFSAATQLGGLVAEADAKQIHALGEYGRKLGLAFQIVDDLLDVSGDCQTVGKRLQKDAQQGKLTYPGLIGVDECRETAARLIDEACNALAVFGEDASELTALARYVVERDH